MAVLYALAAAVFVSLFVLLWLVLTALMPSRTALDEQIDVVEAAYKAAHEAPDDEPEGYFARRPVLNRAVGWTTSLAERGGVMDDLQVKLERAGLSLRASEFVFIHVCSVVGVGLLAALAAGNWLIAALTVPVLTAAPLMVLAYLKAKREARFHDQLPDTLDLIAGALKAGYSLLQALDITAQETSPPISTEFKRVLAETRLGLSLEQGLDHMAARVNSTTFDWTVMAVRIQRDVGGNLAEVLGILADTVRQRERVHRQIEVLTSEGRLSAIILFLLPLTIAGLLFVLNPGYIAVLFTTTTGYVLLGTAIGLMAVGAIWLRKIVVIEV